MYALTRNKHTKIRMTIVGVRLREMRERANLTQKELAERIGVSNNQVYRYEHGDNEPTASNLLAIARELRVSIDYLCGFSDDPKAMDRSVLSPSEQRLLNAFRVGDMDAVVDIFADELRKYRAARLASVPSEPVVKKG